MAHDLREELERCIAEKHEISERLAAAKTRYNAILEEDKAIDAKLRKVRRDIDRALSVADEPPQPRNVPRESDPELPPDRPPVPRIPPGVPPSLWDIVVAIPVESDATTKEIRDANPGRCPKNQT